MPNQYTRSPEEWRAYFFERAIPEPMSGCWLWLGPLDRNGYGRHGGQSAHRIAWRLTFGPPGRRHVCHRCDVPSCINPDHLFIGTREENMADMVAKGRQAFGERNGHSKLTEKLVRKIRERSIAGQTTRSLATEYGISPSTIWSITAHRTWRDA